MITRKISSMFVWFAASLLLAACNFPGFQPQPTKTIEAQAVIETANANAMLSLTQTASGFKPSPVPASTIKPDPVVVPTIGPTQKPVNTGSDAAALAGETIPDETKFLPGSTFTKTWRLMNTGSSTWTNEYRLVFADGEKMGAKDEYYIPLPVEPGKIIDMSVQMKAPDAAGAYQSFWKIKNPGGKLFGPGGSGSFWVKIVVVTPTPTATTQPTATPTVTIETVIPTSSGG